MPGASSPDLFIAEVILCVLLFSLTFVLMVIFSLIPATAKGMRGAWPDIISAAITVSLVIVGLWLGGWLLTILLLVVAFRINYEAVSVLLPADQNGAYVHVAFAFVGSLITGLGMYLSFAIVAKLAAFSLLGLLILLIISNKRQGSWHTSLLKLSLFPMLPMAVFAAVANSPDNAALILGIYILVEVFDSYALLGGKAFGKTKVFPNLSPKKTLEGFVSGVIILLITTAIAANILIPDQVWLALGVAVLSGVLTITGDLLASALKRQGGVKDFPKVSRRQGGLLDIFDAWITSVAGIALIGALLLPLA